MILSGWSYTFLADLQTMVAAALLIISALMALFDVDCSRFCIATFRYG